MANDFERNLARLAAQIPGWASQAMALATLKMEEHAKQNAPWVDRTANLRNSIQGGVVEANGQTVEGALSMGYPGFGMSMEYAGFVELGTSRSAAYPAIWPAVQAIAAQHVFERALQSYLQQGLGG